MHHLVTQTLVKPHVHQNNLFLCIYTNYNLLLS
nr:MAG TPA: hypothetical protein [Caudoviricetes sp.]